MGPWPVWIGRAGGLMPIAGNQVPSSGVDFAMVALDILGGFFLDRPNS